MSEIRERSNPKTRRTIDVYDEDVPVRRRTRRSARQNLNIFNGSDANGPEPEDVVQARRAYESTQIADPFKSSYASGVNVFGPEHILPPPYNPNTLLRFPNENNTLRQCVDAMVINIESMGHRLEYIGDDEEEGAEESKEAKAEKLRLEALLDQPNGEYSLIELRERVRRDLETLGYRFIEVCRGDYTQTISSYYHVPAHTMRLTAADAVETEVNMWLLRDGQYVKQKIRRRFRRFIQEVGTNRVYFKEYGDPRIISSKDGKVYDTLPPEDRATEIHYYALYTPGSPYGTPRWVNQLPAVMGSRESELTNLQFFKDNAIPAMAILVAGGHLTADSIDEIEDHVNSVQGRKSIHRIMVLEAEGMEKAAGPDKTIPGPKIEMKPLASERQSDALFQEYDKNNQTKVRSSFRIPPIFIGKSEDMTYATAQASLTMAEAQVFGPERNKVDDFFNFVILSDKEGRPPQLWRFRSNPPRISDPQTIVNALEVFDAIGALTPNIAIGIANELFDLSIPPVDEDWGDYPFDITMQLLTKDQLKGLEGIRDKLNEANEKDKLQNDKLTPNEKETVQEKVLDPLNKLVAKKDVRKMRKQNRRAVKRK